MNPTIGRIVWVVVRDNNGGFVTRPAIVTRTWGGDSTAIQATVFPDGSNDGLGETLSLSSLMQDESGKGENTWHWPPTNIRSVHPGKAEFEKIGEELLNLCHEIENFPASELQTNVSIQAGNIRHKLRALCERL